MAEKPSGITWNAGLEWLRRRRLLSLGMAVIALVLSLIAAPHIEYDSDPTVFFPDDAPEVEFWLDMTRRFGALDVLLIGLEEPRQPLSFEGLSALNAITEKLAERKAEGLLSVRSLTNVSTLRKGEDDTINAELLVPAIPREAGAREKLKQRILADTQVPGALVSHDLMGYMILVQADPRKNPGKVADVVQNIVEQNRGRLSANYFGGPFVTNQITQGVYRQLYWLVPIFVIALLAVLFGIIRRAKLVIAVLASAGLSLVIWLGMMFLFGLQLSTTAANASLVLLVVAAVLYGRGAEAWLSGAHPPFTARSVILLLSAAVAFGSLGLAPLPFLAAFGRATAAGMLGIAFFGAFGFGPLMAMLHPDHTPDIKASDAPGKYSPSSSLNKGVLVSVVGVIIFGAIGLFNIRFYSTLPEIFSEKDDVGAALDFFERRFGGYDFVQISVKGDMKKPDNLARLLAITDLLEASDKFSDARGISQVVAFMASQFSDFHRIPAEKEALENLLFFLEGQADIRPMISEGWNEAMVAARIPSKSAFDSADWTAEAQKTVDLSAAPPIELGVHRLLALGHIYGIELSPSHVRDIVQKASDSGARKQQVADETTLSRLYEYMMSPDSPFEPSSEDWETLKALLQNNGQDVEARLTEAIKALDSFKEMGYPDDVAAQVADMLVVRRRTLNLSESADRLVDELLPAEMKASRAFRVRAKGVFADIISNRDVARDSLTITISGLPAITPIVQKQLKNGTIMAAFVLWLVMAIGVFLITRSGIIARRAATESLLSMLFVFGLGWLFGIQMDSASATLYLLPPLLPYFLSPWVTVIGDHRLPRPAWFSVVFSLALALASCTLVFTGVLPVERLGGVLVFSLVTAAIIAAVSRRIPVNGLSSSTPD